MTSEMTPTVLVTGAAKRLGRALALHLAHQGWRVALHYRASAADAQATLTELQAAAPHLTHQAFCADLSQPDAARTLVPQVVAAFGRLDAVVNSAALFEFDEPRAINPELMQQHFASNTLGPVLLAQALFEHRQTLSADTAPGVVVNLLDQKLFNPNPDFFSYTLSKAALHAATDLLARGLAPKVRVVGVAPGLTLTSHMLSDAEFAQLHALSPLGRSSTPEDVAATVHFALTNRSITGTTLLVDGGQHLMPFARDFSLMPGQQKDAQT